MDLLTERRLRYVLALRRIREATLFRDCDKIPELMNFHRLDFRPSTLHFSGFQVFSVSKIRYSARPARLSKAGRSNGRCREGRADWRFILVAEQNAAFAEPSRWSTTSPSVQSAGME